MDRKERRQNSKSKSTTSEVFVRTDSENSHSYHKRDEQRRDKRSDKEEPSIIERIVSKRSNSCAAMPEVVIK